MTRGHSTGFVDAEPSIFAQFPDNKARPTVCLEFPAMNTSTAPCYSCSATLWTYVAAAASLAALAGSLYLSLGMGLKACPLCFYQRVFAMSTVGVLLLGLLVPGGRPGLASLLALPAAT